MPWRVARILASNFTVFGPRPSESGGSNSSEFITIGSPSFCSYQTPLPIGTHQVRAVYLGDANFNGSISNIGVVNTSPRPKPR
jgi:hypothetical protein